MRKSARLITLLYLTVAIVSSTLAQVAPTWVKRYNGPVNGADYANALAVEGNNMFVAGSITATATSNDNDYVLLNLGTSGVLEWDRTYDGTGNYDDQATGVVVGQDGHIYVTGSSPRLPYGAPDGVDYDVVTRAYDNAGALLWSHRYDGPAGLPTLPDDSPYAIADDADSNVIVVGFTYQPGGSTTDGLLIKYSGKTGDTLWTRRFNGPGNSDDRWFELIVDKFSNVYVVGYCTGIGTMWDYVTAKYLPNGDTAWVRYYNGPNGWNDEASNIAIDDSGNVYVSGWSTHNSGQGDILTIKYSPSGSQLWATRSSNSYPDNSYDIAVDGSGYVYVAGDDYTSQTAYDAILIKYSPIGSVVWTKRFDGTANGRDYFHRMALDSQGNIYVTGASDGIGSNYDIVTLKYTPAGNVLWSGRYNGPGNGNDYATGLTVANCGDVLVTGYGPGVGTGNDITVIKFDQCLDSDGDAIPDLFDNCPLVANANQADANNDRIGDACCCVGTRGNVNYIGIADLSDLSSLVSFLTGGGYILPCQNEANVNAAGIVDLSDLSSLVSYLTGGGYVLPNCP